MKHSNTELRWEDDAMDTNTKPENDIVIPTEKILLHICCGPCSLFVIDELRRLFGNIEIHGLYANPNIHPYVEFIRRRENAKIAAEYKKIPIECLENFDQDTWEFYDNSQAKRCEMCYNTRMEIAAGYAKEHGFSCFTTSLLVSPYQNHEKIREAGRKAAEKYGLRFFYYDYSIGYRRGQNEAREIGLYRQKYCGCIKSKEYK